MEHVSISGKGISSSKPVQTLFSFPSDSLGTITWSSFDLTDIFSTNYYFNLAINKGSLKLLAFLPTNISRN
jgi:hypothetical protein